MAHPRPAATAPPPRQILMRPKPHPALAMGVPPPQMRFQRLAPAPPRPPPVYEPRVTFLSLPPEMRVEIYKLAMKDVIVHVLPCGSPRRAPHPLLRTTRQIRQEVLPLMQSRCPIRATITDFNFDGLREWLQRIPPDQEDNLCKNKDLVIKFATTTDPPKSIDSLRKWLHMRADKYRPQPEWKYQGMRPPEKVCKELARKAKRMKHEDRQREMWVILKSLGIDAPTTVGRPRGRGD